MHTAPLHSSSAGSPASPSPRAAAASGRAALTLGALAAIAVGLGGCAEGRSAAAKGPADSGLGPDTGGEAEPGLPQPPFGRLKIEELYYSGATAPGDGHLHTYSDQFTDLRNDSDEPVVLDGLCIGDALGPAGEINPGMRPWGLAERYPDHAVLGNVWCLPGAGAGLVLEPGATLLLVQDGLNHQPISTLDHSGADYEAYNERRDGADEDSPTVPNLDRLLFNGGYDWLVTVFGPSMVIFTLPEGEALPMTRASGFDAAQIPKDWVIDAVNAVMDGDSLDFRRLPPVLDAGAAWVSGTYTGESLRRRVGEGGRLLDSDDSSVDLELNPSPSPGG